MMLADMGAEVIRVDRAHGTTRVIDADPSRDVTARGRSSIAMDLKNPEAIHAVLRLCTQCDGLIEGFRPGVMEKLGLGPEPCRAANRGSCMGA
jgi:alpha-methylacyl-CoA racemase